MAFDLEPMAGGGGSRNSSTDLYIFVLTSSKVCLQGPFLSLERSLWPNSLFCSVWFSPVGYQLPLVVRKLKCHITL